MRRRPIRPGLESYQKEVEDEFETVLKETEQNKSENWNLAQLDTVLKSLKKKQSPDAKGLVNELLCYDNIGSDLKRSILMLCNNIKDKTKFPSLLEDTFISAIPKKRKSPLDLENERGIFLVSKIRSILMKLVYNSNYEVIEENLSNSNIGARKQKAPRDHLFVLNSVINDVTNGRKKKPVDIVFYDVCQCFDSLWVEKTLLDLYKKDIKDNTLNLIYEASKNANIQIKTPVGISKKQSIKSIVMQGETLSSILCTCTIDTISNECDIENYKYRDSVGVPKLGFVDDLVDIQPCGDETKNMNNYTDLEISKRKLQC